MQCNECDKLLQNVRWHHLQFFRLAAQLFFYGFHLNQLIVSCVSTHIIPIIKFIVESPNYICPTKILPMNHHLNEVARFELVVFAHYKLQSCAN